MKTKIAQNSTTIVRLFLYYLAFLSLPLRADVPGNIVVNGTFQAQLAYWNDGTQGVGQGVIFGTANSSYLPTGIFALVSDIYQNVGTAPGHQYQLTFYTSPDFYYGLETDVEVQLNEQSAGTFVNIYSSGPYPTQRYDNSLAQWQQFSTLFTASTYTTRVEFVGVSTFDFGLAEVSVVPVPEPSGIALLLMGTGAGLIRRHKQ